MSDLTFIADDDAPEGRRRGHRPSDDAPVVAPEPLRRVRVLPPFQVVRDGTAYWPEAVVEVPEPLAATWLLNRWLSDAR